MQLTKEIYHALNELILHRIYSQYYLVENIDVYYEAFAWLDAIYKQPEKGEGTVEPGKTKLDKEMYQALNQMISAKMADLPFESEEAQRLRTTHQWLDLAYYEQHAEPKPKAKKEEEYLFNIRTTLKVTAQEVAIIARALGKEPQDVTPRDVVSFAEDSLSNRLHILEGQQAKQWGGSDA